VKISYNLTKSRGHKQVTHRRKPNAITPWPCGHTGVISKTPDAEAEAWLEPRAALTVTPNSI
jgi:hypothetical protein